MAKQISNTKPFEVVYTLVRHPYFGILPELNAVLLNPSGTLSLSHQRVHGQTAAYFGLSGSELEAVRLLDEMDVDNIMKQFYTGSKRLRPEDFFIKQYNEELHKKVRPYIEKRIARVMELIGDRQVFLESVSNNPVDTPIEVCHDHATILFHFRKDEEGINYFATIKHRDTKLEFSCNSSELLCTEPAWLLAENKLVRFAKGVDGKKIKPFLKKKFIHIPKDTEGPYLEKFVKPLLERYDVFAQGFSIVSEQHQATPVLRLEEGLTAKPCLSLYLNYGKWNFPYHSEKQVHVSLIRADGTFEFHRIKRSRNWEEQKVKWLTDNGLEPVQGSLFSLQEAYGSDALALIDWLNEHAVDLQRQGFTIDQSALSRKIFIGEVSLSLNVKARDDWFDLSAEVRFGNFVFPFTRLRASIIKGIREFPLPDGSIAIIPAAWMTRLAKVFHFGDEEGDLLSLKKMHHPLLDELGEFQDSSTRKAPAVIPRPEDMDDMPLPEGFTGTLRAYQQTGYNWLNYLGSQHLGGCLADDMGLGKTIQTLAYLQSCINKNEHLAPDMQFSAAEDEPVQLSIFHPGEPEPVEPRQASQTNIPDARPESRPCLVVAPTSLIYNWQQEARRFNPSMRTLVYAGTQRERYFGMIGSSDLVISSYGTIRNDASRLAGVKFRVVVLDESQAIKNPLSLTARALLQIQAEQKIALTGTPVENTLLDLWSQMNFLNPGLLGTYRYFQEHYIKPIERSQDKKRGMELARLVKPYILRRTKKQVTPELPEKFEKVHYCEMTSQQRELYEKTKSQYRNEILDSIQQHGANRSRFKVIAGLTRLRQLAINPLLMHEDFEGGSGKYEQIIHMLQRAIEGGHKVLVFSQFVQHLSIIENWLSEAEIDYCKLIGDMPGHERAAAIDRFQNEEQVSVFLLSLKAGNAGINLTAADYVFLCDPWWNPFVMQQAESRAHRIGQQKPVFSYKFITRDSIEEKILNMQERKKQLAGTVMEGEEQWIGQLSEAEIQELFD